MAEFPTQARAVIIGGGIVGCSTAYHLAKLGWQDTIIIERHKLTSGSTHHAAGLVGQLRTSANITQLLGESVRLYDTLEAETGLASGWKMNGGLRLACNAARWIELKRQATGARSFGLEMQLLTPARGAGAVAADGNYRSGGCRLPADRRPGEPLGHHPVARQGRAHARRAHLRGHQRARHRARAGARGRGADDPGARGVRSGRQLRRAVGATGRRAGRRERAAGFRAAPVPDHRCDSRHHRGLCPRCAIQTA